MKYYKYVDTWVDEPNIATTYVETDDGCEIRHLSVIDQRFISSNMDLLLGEGQVDYTEVEEAIPIPAEEFIDVWNTYLDKYLPRWTNIKANFPIGFEIVGFIKIFFPQGVIVSLGNNVWGLADYKKCQDSCARPEYMSSWHKITGIVRGYDEINQWIMIASPQVHEEEISPNP